MLKFKTSAILTFILCALLLGSCTSESENSNNAAPPSTKRIEPQTPKANDNAEELGTLVKLPFEPAEVAWRETPNGLIAVLLYSPETAKKLADAAAKIKEPEAASVEVEEWFPAELTAKRDMGAGSTLTGKAYSAQDILQDPFTSGRLVHLDDTDYFVLDLKKN